MPRCRFATKRDAGISLQKEPFRLFFPAGILASIVGVALWPLLYAGWLDFYPGEAHARLMVQGFVGAFALGFLGTAFPKMIESPSLTWPELAVLLSGNLGGMIAIALGHVTAGDGLFVLTWVSLLGFLSVRLAFLGQDLPPPGFVLAGIGLFAGVTGAVMLLIQRINLPSTFERSLAQLLLYEAFILCPIAGIGGFLFSRFFTVTSTSVPEPNWNREAFLALAVGAAIIGTIIAQASGWARSAPAARAAIIAVYLIWHGVPLRFRTSQGTLSTMLKIAIGCLVLGLLLSGLSVIYSVALKHILFIGGYGLLILAVASRVAWGHSGNIHLAEGTRRSLRFIVGIVLLAMATRVVADLIPAIRVSHHVYAALSWVIATVIWSAAALRFVAIADRDG